MSKREGLLKGIQTPNNSGPFLLKINWGRGKMNGIKTSLLAL
jgi:hypothetical protein